MAVSAAAAKSPNRQGTHGAIVCNRMRSTKIEMTTKIKTDTLMWRLFLPIQGCSRKPPTSSTTSFAHANYSNDDNNVAAAGAIRLRSNGFISEGASRCVSLVQIDSVNQRVKLIAFACSVGRDERTQHVSGAAGKEGDRRGFDRKTRNSIPQFRFRSTDHLGNTHTHTPACAHRLR